MRSCSWNRLRLCALSGALLVLCPDAARADDAPRSWWQQITLNAFASASYTWNFNNPSTNLNQYRAFDYRHNSVSIDAAELVVQKAVANPGDFGFRIDLAMGNVANVAAARGLFRDPDTGKAGDFDLQQAFASYIVPVGRGLRFDVGKFVTPVGAEYIDGYDGYNDNFSRSLLFTLAIPFTHTGFKLSYPFSDKLTAMVMLVNGWDDVVDNNSAKSFGVSLAVTPVAPLSIYVNYIGGPERDHDDQDWRHLVDVGVVWKATGRLTVTLNGDWGLDASAVPPPVLPMDPVPAAPMDPAAAPADLVGAKNAQWAGVALYLRAQATRRLAFIGRGEIFWDFDGFRTGVAQRLMEATVTAELRVTDSFLVRPEFRIDQSDQSVFIREDGLTRHYQPTVAINALYVF